MNQPRNSPWPSVISYSKMRRAIEISPAGDWLLEAAVATVSLQFHNRYRRRIRLTDDTGEDFLLDLVEPSRFRNGDGLVLDDGGILAVRAAPEAVIDIICKTAEKKTQIAWHLGNRHTAVQILPGGNLRICQDHVLEKMVQGLGAATRRLTAPFEPEGGAYERSHTHNSGTKS